MSDNKYFLYAGLAVAGVATLIGGLYIKNKVLYTPLPKGKVIEITRDLRKLLQASFQNIITISEKTRMHNMPPEALKHIVEGEDSMNLKLTIRETTDKVCQKYDTNGIDYEKALAFYHNDPEIKKCKAILEKDYELALKGQVNSQLFGNLPEISSQKLFDIVKKKVQQDFLNKLEQIKLTKDKSEADLNNPTILAEMNKLESAGVQQILTRNGLKSDTDALIHVYNILVSNLEKSDAGFRVKVKNIEATYNQIFEKYIRAYSQTGNQEHLNNLEDEILYKEV